jgi:hypothetical protein
MKRITLASLDARITKLEIELAQLRSEVQAKNNPGLAGWRRIVGTIPNDALTRRAARYGREYRESTKNNRAKTKKKRKG